MAVKRYAPIDIQALSLSVHPVHYLCTTTAELPASGLKLGDTALAQDTNIQYKALNSTTWTPISTAAGAVPFSKVAVFADGAGLVPTTVAAWVAPFPCTLTAMKGFRVGGTGATINAFKGSSATLLRSADFSISSANTWMTASGALQNTAFNTTDTLYYWLTSVTGTVTQVTLQLDYTRP